jgi:hypothetical protein
MEENQTKIEEEIRMLQRWSKDIFLFAYENMNMLPAEPIDELCGVPIPYTNAYGEPKTAMLFDQDGRLIYHDLSFYKVGMFKNQRPHEFKRYNKTRFTWQQTVKLEAYNRALQTFGKDSFDVSLRWITTRSGHGTGKTASTAVIANHFLTCFPGCQIGMTANTEQQVNDIFMKEFYVWKDKLPEGLKGSIRQTADHIYVGDDMDWFLRAQVARPEKPEALAGLHADFILIIVDEASGVADSVFEVMKGALTGGNYIVLYDSNPTRNEGEFYNSHKAGSRFTKLHFSSRQSPIVEEGYVEGMEADYPSNGGVPSDEVKIRVDGVFAGTNEMDDKGWMPLFANMTIHFEPEQGQIIRGGIFALDPAGGGKDRAIGGVRDNIYLKEVLNEQTSNPKDLARKVETICEAYEINMNDAGIEAFGIGAEVVANVSTKMGENINALLTDKPREGTEKEFASWKAELAWMFRRWVATGGIIITNNKAAWIKEMEKIKYKRDRQGRIVLQGKVEFKKDNKFSPDRFDMAIHTFFKENPTRPVILTKAELQTQEIADFLHKVQATQVVDDTFSSM